MRVIGTAGHVDHGKSTLITALTGINPDRLKEEREREMTIDLGFAWLTLPDGEEVGIVDVPGHRDFIENMLAGIGGIDAALLVIAANEGIMPQTREHLAILNLLKVQAGIVVLTKIDLVDEAGWLELVEGDIRDVLHGTVLQEAPIIRVSSRTKEGLSKLVETLSQVLRDQPARPDLGRPRLPIDRVFSITGFGTVITGTLTDGTISVGDEVEILPSGQKGRVRGLQTHKKKEEAALPGSRTAVNISGINLESIRRGEVMIRPGQYHPTQRMDVRFHLLPDAANPLRHANEVKVFIGTSETVATVRLLGIESLEPGQEGWLQLDLHHPVVAVRGDRYILRRPSPGETIGGGTVIDPHPKARHKRFDKKVIEGLETLAQGSPAEILLQASLNLGPATIKEVFIRSRLDIQKAITALEELIKNGQLITLEEGDITIPADILAVPSTIWKNLSEQTQQILDTYHRTHPLRQGIPREELKSRLKYPVRVFNAVIRKLAGDNLLTETNSWIARPEHKIRFTREQQDRVKSLFEKFANAPFAPPTIKECQAEIGEEVFSALVESGELVVVSQEIAFIKADYERLVSGVQKAIMKNGQVTVADARDLFNTSRRYVLALLEHLDTIGFTVRDGDYRKLRRS